MKEYFYNKNYTAIYLYSALSSFAKSFLSVFSAVLLYKLGYSISIILLFYGICFLFMGLLSPLSLISIGRIGMVKSLCLSNMFLLVGAYFLIFPNGLSVYNLLFIFLSFSIQGGIEHPIIHGLDSFYIKNEDKGKFNSLKIIFVSLASILSVFLSGNLVSTGNKIILFILIGLSLLLGSLCLSLLDEYVSDKKYSFGDVYSYLLSKNFRNNLIPFGLQTFSVIEKIFTSLFIFITLGDIKSLSFVVGFALIFEFFIVIFFGKWMDKFSSKSFFVSVLIKSSASLFFIFFKFNGFIIFLNKLYSQLSLNIFLVAFRTLYQTKGQKEKNPILFASAKEMILCFTEFFVFLALAILAYFIDKDIFVVIFFVSFLGTWGIYKTWKN